MAGALDGTGELFLVVEADSRIVAGFDPLETVDEVPERWKVLVVDLAHLIGAEGAAALSQGVFLGGGEDDVLWHAG